jgi:hypothetical protein
MTKHDAMWLSIINAAAAGDHKAQMKMIAYLQAQGRMGEPQEASKQEPFTADDEASIADFLRRYADPVDAAQSPQSNGNSQAKEAKPTSTETTNNKDTKDTKS